MTLQFSTSSIIPGKNINSGYTAGIHVFFPRDFTKNDGTPSATASFGTVKSVTEDSSGLYEEDCQVDYYCLIVEVESDTSIPFPGPHTVTLNNAVKNP